MASAVGFEGNEFSVLVSRLLSLFLVFRDFPLVRHVWLFVPCSQDLPSVGTSPHMSLRAEEKEDSEAEEELLCKPPVWVDLPVWFPEPVAQATEICAANMPSTSIDLERECLLVPAVTLGWF